jgi:hypothetical protein
VKTPDSAFVDPREARVHRQTLLAQYVAAFRHVEAAALVDARSALKKLSTQISVSVIDEQRAPLRALIEGQLAKLV